MTRERRVLLIILAAALFLSLFGSLLYVGLEKLAVTQERIDRLRKQYLRLPAGAPGESVDLHQRIRELERAESAELGRYYDKDEIDLYRFGSAVNAMLAHHGIIVEQFRTVTETNRSVLELTLRGTSPSFMAFLSEVSAAQKYWTIPYLHIQSSSGNGSLTCELQIGYLSHENVAKTP